MITRAMLMILVVVCTLSSLSKAEEGKSVVAPPTDSTQGRVMPAVNQKFVQNVKEAVDMKNVTEIFNQVPDSVNYDEKGNIEYVTLKDGAKVKYSYEYDEEGKLSSVRLTSDNLILEFRAAEDKDNEPQSDGAKHDVNKLGDTMITVDAYGPKGGKKKPIIPQISPKEPDTPTVIINIPGASLPQIARSPINFDKIKDGFNKALKEKNRAYEEYMKNTAPYYEKILNELEVSAGGLKAEGLKSGINGKNKNPDGSIDARQRKNVDEAVRNIRKMAEEGRGEVRQAERFIAVERILANKFLNPNRQIFEDKVKQAVDCVNKIIDTVIKSKLAVYLNVKKDKIEAIVNLPEVKKK